MLKIFKLTQSIRSFSHPEFRKILQRTIGTQGKMSTPGETTNLCDIIRFLELVGKLKHLKRAGWVLRDVRDCETVAGHMYRMSMMTFLLEDNSKELNRVKCMELAIVHDLAECLVGDITPYCGISKQDKMKKELEAMEEICELIKPRSERLLKLFEEYEAGETAEAKFVKDLDRLDMVLQAFEYEKRDQCPNKHQEFFDSTDGKFNHPLVKDLVTEIKNQRQTILNNIELKTAAIDIASTCNSDSTCDGELDQNIDGTSAVAAKRHSS